MIGVRFISLDSFHCLLSKYMIITYVIKNMNLSSGLENLRNDLFDHCELPLQASNLVDMAESSHSGIKMQCRK